MGEILETVRRHPVVASVISTGAAIATVAVFIAELWPVLVGSETIPDFLIRKGWVLTMPSWYYSSVLILVCAVVILQVVLIRALRHRQEAEGTLAIPADPKEETKPTFPQSDGTLDNAEEKERFRLFIQEVMHRACFRMQWMANQVHGTLFNQPVSTREKRLLHYSVEAYLFFMQPLEDSEKTLRDFLAARESLSNDDFLSAQHLFLDLYNVYEQRQPWLRDMSWETFPEVSTYSVYTDWQAADHDMREGLITLVRECRVLGDNIRDLHLPTPRRWEKGGS